MLHNDRHILTGRTMVFKPTCLYKKRRKTLNYSFLILYLAFPLFLISPLSSPSAQFFLITYTRLVPELWTHLVVIFSPHPQQWQLLEVVFALLPLTCCLISSSAAHQTSLGFSQSNFVVRNAENMPRV